jgi:FixJ family two-component response regulator
LAAAGYRIPIIFITAYADEEIRAQALEAEAVAFLTKPFREEALLKGIRSAPETYRGGYNALTTGMFLSAYARERSPCREGEVTYVIKLRTTSELGPS